MTPEVSFDIEVWCACGAGLCNQSRTEGNRRGYGTHLHVEPCELCLEESRRKGFDEGYDKALEEQDDE